MAIIQSLVAKYEKKYNDNSFFYNIYANQYRKILSNEIKLADINQDDSVLNIGCGGMPFTAIFLNKMTNARIIAIDHDEEAVKKASNIVKKLSLNNIVVIHSKGQNIQNIRFTKALIALQAEPKIKILENLIRISPKGAKLIFRQPRNIFKGNYDYLDDKKADDFIKQKMITFNKSLLFIVK